MIKSIKNKVNHIVICLIVCGAIMMILGILVAYSNFAVRLAIGMFIIVISFIFFYGAYKILDIKKDINKLLKF